MKQLFTAGAGINIAPNNVDQTKQLISAKVDNETIKVSSDGKLISQKLFTNPGEPLQIDADNNIRIAYDGTTIVKDVDTGKLKSALTVDKPLEITNSTNLKLNIDSKTMDTTADGKLTAK